MEDLLLLRDRSEAVVAALLPRFAEVGLHLRETRDSPRLEVEPGRDFSAYRRFALAHPGSERYLEIRFYTPGRAHATFGARVEDGTGRGFALSDWLTRHPDRRMRGPVRADGTEDAMLAGFAGFLERTLLLCGEAWQPVLCGAIWDTDVYGASGEGRG